MRKAYLYSNKGRFYYAVRPECIYSKKMGKISRGWYKKMALWPQRELREDSADYVQWRWSKERDFICFNSYRYDAPEFMKNGMPEPWGYAENTSKATFYITSVYELIMTEKAEWMKWEGDLTQGGARMERNARGRDEGQPRHYGQTGPGETAIHHQEKAAIAGISFI